MQTTKHTPGDWRPMIFSAESILGIHDGTKTETRRVITSLKGGQVCPPDYVLNGPEPGMPGYWEWLAPKAVDRVRPRWTERPRWLKGEQVYACEAIQFTNFTPWRGGTQLRVRWHYAADKAQRVRVVPAGAVDVPKAGDSAQRWRRSPPYVPRWAARTGLLIEDVRPERLQALTPEAAEREGVAHFGKGAAHDPLWDRARELGITHPYVAAYFVGWSKLHARHPWAEWGRNPWVWVYTVKVIERQLLLPPSEG